MAYQSKTWSLSDEVVAEIERRVASMEKGSPNKVLKDLLFPRTATLINRLTGEKELTVDLDAEVRDFDQRRQEVRSRIMQGARRTPREKGDGKR